MQKLEEYVKNKFGIPRVSFTGLDKDVIIEIIKALNICYQKFPKLKDVICSIGDNNIINEEYNLAFNYHNYIGLDKLLSKLYYSSPLYNKLVDKIKNTKLKEELSLRNEYYQNVEYDEACLDNLGIFFSLYFRDRINNKYLNYLFNGYIAIGYSNLIKEYDLDTINEVYKMDSLDGWSPKHCMDIKESIYHEIGHILFFILDLDKDYRFYRIMQKYSNDFTLIKEKISEYAYVSYNKGIFSEVVAEAFAEYIYCPNSNNLVYYIGKYIEYKYNLEKDNIYNYNYKYKKHLNRCQRLKTI